MPLFSKIVAKANPPPKSSKIPQGSFSVSFHSNSGLVSFFDGNKNKVIAPSKAIPSSPYLKPISSVIGTRKIHPKITTPKTTKTLI